MYTSFNAPAYCMTGTVALSGSNVQPDTMESSAASMALSNGWLPFLDADMEDS